MALIDWIKDNIKEGASLAEAEKLYKEENPLQGIETIDQALELIKSNKTLQRALDSETSKRVDNALDRFQEEKLPNLLKEKEEILRKELNPEETPEQKRIRELEERIQLADQKEAMNKRKAELRDKAKAYAQEKGIDFDPLMAEKFASFGDNAENELISTIDYFDSYAKKAIDSTLKGAFKGKAPEGGNGPVLDATQKIAEMKKAGNLDGAVSTYFGELRNKVINGEN
jgi:hypothetical protein